MQVAGSPELYPVLVDIEGCILTLLACLSHENTDIAADTLELFMELTGGGEQGCLVIITLTLTLNTLFPIRPDAVEEYQEEAKMLVDAMIEGNALELLVQRLLSLNEKVGRHCKCNFMKRAYSDDCDAD